MLLEAIADGVRGLVSRRNAYSSLDSRIWADLGFVQESTSGVKVTADSALRISTVYACVLLLSDTVAQLPVDVRQDNGDGTSDKVNKTNIATVLRSRPNQWQTSFEWRQMMTSHVLLRGNAYSRIVPGPLGAIDQLLPMHPDRMKVEKLVNGRLRYTYTTPQGQPEYYMQDEMFHLRGLSKDGLKGMDPIALARDTIGLTAALEWHEASLFKNGARPAIAIRHPGTITPAAAENIRKSFERIHGGVENAGKTAVLEEGMDVTTLGMTNENAQFIESREFQISDIARIFRVPLHLIQDTRAGAVGYASVEQLSLAFVKFTLGKWLKLWEEAVKRDLIVEDDIFIKFNLNGLLRGDITARGAFFRTMWEIGAFSDNDIRELEDLDPVEGGDQRFVPLNYIPLDLAREKAEAAIAKDEQAAKPPPAPVAAPEPMPNNDQQMRDLEHRMEFWHDEAAKLTLKIPDLEVRLDAITADAAKLELDRNSLAKERDNLSGQLTQANETRLEAEKVAARRAEAIAELDDQKKAIEIDLCSIRTKLDALQRDKDRAVEQCSAILLDAASRMTKLEMELVRRIITKSKFKSGNFIVQMEQIYAEHEPRYLEAMRCPCEMYQTLTGTVMKTDELVARHIDNSKEQLLACAGRATAETLAAEVSAVIEQWPTRSSEWTTIGGTNANADAK